MGLELLLLLLGCADCDGESGDTLVDFALWEEVPAAEDPFDDRPASVDCPPSSWSLELSPATSLELDTGFCNYLTLRAPSRFGVCTDQALDLLVSHDILSAETPAEAHFALRLGDETLLEEVVAIPAEANGYSLSASPSTDLPTETPFYIHLHNHGENTWNVYEPTLSLP